MNSSIYELCPICKTITENIPGRYVNIVCNNCIDTYGMLDKNGYNIKFGNINLSGGFKSIITLDNGTQVNGEGNECYINGFKCKAEEARFGGIVIQCVENTNKRRKK